MDYVALKTELQADPNGLGYAAAIASGSDNILANLLNAVNQNINITRDILKAYEIFDAVDPTDYSGLTAAKKTDLQLILGMGEVDVLNANTRSLLAGIFGAGSATRTALLALQNRKGSRAEQLFGRGVFVTAADIAIALRGAS